MNEPKRIDHFSAPSHLPGELCPVCDPEKAYAAQNKPIGEYNDEVSKALWERPETPE